MKVIIAGSRTIELSNMSMLTLEEAISAAFFVKKILITEVVSGGARGADRLGEMWARNHNKPIKLFKADWHTYGTRAGYLRNQEMANYADALIAVWDGVSRGTGHMISIANTKGIPVHVVLSPGPLPH